MRRAHLSTTEGSNRAAAYVRMSTEHQQYSTENQLDAIKDILEVARTKNKIVLFLLFKDSFNISKMFFLCSILGY